MVCNNVTVKGCLRIRGLALRTIKILVDGSPSEGPHRMPEEPSLIRKGQSVYYTRHEIMSGIESLMVNNHCVKDMKLVFDISG